MSMHWVHTAELLDELHQPVFGYQDPTPPESLRRSVAADGILTPLLVSTHGLVCGYRRLALAKEFGLSEVPTRRVCGDPLRLFQLALRDNALHGTPSLADQVRLVRRARARDIGAEDIARDLFPLAGLTASGERIEHIGALGELDPRLLDIVSKVRLDLRRAGVLLTLSAEDQAALADLLEGHRLSRSQARDLVDWSTQIARRDGVSLAQLSGELPRGDRAELMKALMERRFPTLEARRRAVQGLIADSRLPRNLEIDWDHNFEREGIQLRLTLQRPEDLRQLDDLDETFFRRLLEVL